MPSECLNPAGRKRQEEFDFDSSLLPCQIRWGRPRGARSGRLRGPGGRHSAAGRALLVVWCGESSATVVVGYQARPRARPAAGQRGSTLQPGPGGPDLNGRVESGKSDRFVREGNVPRFGRLADMARVVRLLLEPDSYLTGQVINGSGGFYMHP